MKLASMNWMQVEAYLHSDDRIVLPLGATQQHAYLSLATDAFLAVRLAADAAQPRSEFQSARCSPTVCRPRSWRIRERSRSGRRRTP